MTGSKWSDKFEQGRDGGGRPPGGMSGSLPRDEPDEEALALDLAEYRPWTLQRGRSRPVMMLNLRRYEPKSGMWVGWQIAYPHLVAVEYIGDRMLTLDFGARHFVIQGSGLDQLATALQQGSVLSVQEYAPSIWPTRPAGAFVDSIRKLGPSNAGDKD
jgi:hypothetical protein